MSRHQEHTQKKTTEAAAPAETRSGEAYYHALARTYVAEPYDPGSLRPLRRRIRRDLRTLRRNYEEALTSHRRRPPAPYRNGWPTTTTFFPGKGKAC